MPGSGHGTQKESDNDFQPHGPLRRWANYARIMWGRSDKYHQGKASEKFMLGLSTSLLFFALVPPFSFYAAALFLAHAFNWSVQPMLEKSQVQLRAYRRQHHPLFADSRVRAFSETTSVGFIERHGHQKIISLAAITVVLMPALFTVAGAAALAAPALAICALMAAGSALPLVIIGLQKDKAFLERVRQKAATQTAEASMHVTNRSKRQRLKIKPEKETEQPAVEATTPEQSATAANTSPLRRPTVRQDL